MTSKFLFCSTIRMVISFTKPANNAETGPGLGHGGNLELRSESQGKICCWVQLEAILYLQLLHLPDSHSQSAQLVPKCSCLRFLVESHLLTSCPDCKLPFGMATIFLKHIPNPSFSVGNTMHYPNTAKNIILSVVFLLRVI